MTKTWDYCIVGAGILGCAIGKTVLERDPNASVLILEKFPHAGQGNTIRSNAAYRNIFGTRLNIQLATASINYYRDMERTGEDFGRKEIGYLFLLTAEQYSSFSDETLEYKDKMMSLFDFLDVHAIEYELLSADRLSEVLPELVLRPKSEVATIIEANSIACALWGKQCGNFAPDLVVNHYLRQYTQSGGQILYNTKVLSLKLGATDGEFDHTYVPKVWEDMEIKAVEIESHDGNTDFIKAKHFILTTGAWINELIDELGTRTLVKAKKRQLFTIDGLKEFISNPNFSTKHPVIPFTILPTGGVFIKPLEHAGSAVIGTSDIIGRRFEPTYPITNDRSLLDTPSAEPDFYTFNILPILQSYFPTIFDEYSKIKGTAGYYAYSVDGYPVIDQVKQVGNLVFVTGTSGSGIMKADSIARIAVARIMGEQYATLYDGTVVDATRFGIDTRDLPDETLIL